MEKIMKEAIRTVLESIYAPEDTSHFRSPEGSSSALRRIKEEWGTSRWFLEFDIRQSFHTIDRHRLIPIFKEEIDDPKFFYSIQKVLSAGVGGEKGPDSVPNSVLLSALLGNIYLHKLDQEIGRIRQKYEIPIVQRIRSVLLKKSPIDYQEKGEEGSEKTESALARSGFRAYACFNALQDKRAAIVERIKRIQGKAAFHSLVSSWHTTPGGDQRRPFVPPSSALATFLNKPSSLLFALIEAAGPKAEFYGRESCRAFILQSCKRSLTQRPATEGYEATSRLTPHGSSRYPRYLGTLRALRQREGEVHEAGVYEPAGLGEAASEKGLARNRHYLIRICYARYADDLLLGIVGAVELIIEIKKRIAHFLQSGLNIGAEQPYEPTLPNSLEARPCGSRIEGSTTIAARSTVEFLGMVIREVPPKRTPIQFLRELEKRIRVKHRIHITASHLRSAIHSKFRNLGQSIPVKELTKGMSKTGSLLDAVQLAESLSTASVRSPQVSVLWETVKHIRQGSRGNLSFLHSSGQSKVPSQETVSGTHAALKLSLYKAGEGALHRSISSEFAIRIEAPIKKILRRLRDRGLISRRRPWPIHVACLTNVSDEDIVNWFAGIAISLLSYYRCCDNLYQVRTIVDHQIRWSAIFTLAHKHKSSARNIILKYSKDLKILHHGKTLAEFPNSIELGKLGPRQDTHKKEFR